jgi:hypothetical protein
MSFISIHVNGWGEHRLFIYEFLNWKEEGGGRGWGIS